MNPEYEMIDECIACGSTDLVPVLNLGQQPLANSYKKSPDESESYFPLAINRCEHCFHVQLTHRVNPDLMFKDYAYVSGTAKTQLEYFDWFAEFAKEKFGTMPSTVLDIGCNDGSQLNAFQNRGAETYGVDPAENLFVTSSQRHKVVCGYFTGKEWSNKFDVITCQNAFAHNFDQLELLQNISRVMHSESLLFATTSQCDMILNGEFDTIYHEHLSFYNIKSINALCKRAGLNLIDVVKSPVHGMSYIFIISREYKRAPKTIQNLIDLETQKGLYDIKTYERYAKKCQEVAVLFSGVIKRYREQGIPVVGFGAPAKGNTLMNFAGIGPDFTIDENPLKQGLYCPGVDVPIYGIEKLKELDPTKPVCFIPLAWNFYDEIVKKIKANRQDSGDIFIKYFPSFEIKEEIMYHPV
jgi:SAM-dependent methyltransferase